MRTLRVSGGLCLSVSICILIDKFNFVEDLAGVKVSHDFEELGEGEARILTLKDSHVLDDEGK